MRLTLEPTQKTDSRYRHPKVIVEHAYDDLTLDDIMESMVLPAIIALGYPEKLVRGYFNDEEIE